MWLNIVGGVLALLTTIAQGIGSLANWFRESNLKRQGAQEVETKNLKDANEVLTKAIKVREEAYRDNASVPAADSLPDDGYRRD